MVSDFFFDLARTAVQYLPLVTGAFITILILRFPDLTLEGSWCLGGICACIAIRDWGINGAFAPLIGLAVGGACGLLTAGVFCITGRVKLLAGLVSYYILEAAGFHLLGEKASIYLPREWTSLGLAGLPGSKYWSIVLYVTYAALCVAVLVLLMKSRLGTQLRIVGETPGASMFFRLHLTGLFLAGLVISNAIVGFGGGLMSSYLGQGSNVQGIGLVLAAFFSLLMGDEMLRVLKIAKRSMPLAVVVGACLFAILGHSAEFLQVWTQRNLEIAWFRPTDKQMIIAFAVIAMLWARQRTAEQRGQVSAW